MLAKVATAALMGIDAFRVDLEVDLARQGLPAFVMVGLAEGALRESRERVLAALKNSGFKLPPARITVNLAPADMRKEGSGYDVPLAMGLLAAAGVVPLEALAGYFFAGELSLTGEVKAVPGMLPLAVKARDEGARGVVVPEANGAEAAVVDGLAVYGVRTLGQVVAFVTGQEVLAPVADGSAAAWAERAVHTRDFAEVKGQEHAKRAIEIAAAGSHNLLFMGPPGSGKTMLAQRIPSVLPPLSFDEALEVTKVYSVAGMLAPGTALVAERPFRSPHHTISDAGLIGGGAYPRPGEVSLAHRGVLFLDELPEFKKNVLEVMRQPLEDGGVTIARAAVSLRYPADFMLVAAMNPCPCGHLSDEQHACGCTPQQVQRYRSRISGPLLDRIDLHVEVPAVPYRDLQGRKTGMGSGAMRARIEAARAVQARRYAGTTLLTNSDLSGKWLERFCALGEVEHAFLGQAVSSLGLSARAYTRVLRIARTIADLELVGADGQAAPRDTPDNAAATPPLTVAHLAEAINYRTLDRRQG
ncbi:MAG: YifB family Mg chelatase-like AAA ATPase [Desulfovibrionaceae bacterium]